MMDVISHIVAIISHRPTSSSYISAGSFPLLFLLLSCTISQDLDLCLLGNLHHCIHLLTPSIGVICLHFQAWPQLVHLEVSNPSHLLDYGLGGYFSLGSLHTSPDSNSSLIFRSFGVEILGVLAEIGEFEGVLES